MEITVSLHNPSSPKWMPDVVYIMAKVSDMFFVFSDQILISTYLFCQSTICVSIHGKWEFLLENNKESKHDSCILIPATILKSLTNNFKSVFWKDALSFAHSATFHQINHNSQAVVFKSHIIELRWFYMNKLTWKEALPSAIRQLYHF